MGDEIYMSFAELLILSLGLSMDAFAVSITNGMCSRSVSVGKSLFVAFTFGVFQAVMPLIGFLTGYLFYAQIQAVDHWIAFGLLAFLGGKLILEGYREKSEADMECSVDQKNLSVKQILLQGIATSIDALAVGIGLSVIQADVFVSVSVIGIITFLVCLPAMTIGKKFGTILNDKAQFLGGIILISIGIKILLSHLLG